MKYVVLVIRTMLGLIFTLLGIEHFKHFLNMSMPELTPAAMSFMTALGPTGYMDVVKVIEIAGGLLLLSGFMAPLGLVLLTPVIVNIALFDHLIMKTPGLGLPMLGASIFLIWAYRAYFAPLFTLHARASGCCLSDKTLPLNS